MLRPLSLNQEDIDYASDAALSYCGDCQDYHYIRPHLQATGYPLGPWPDEAVFAPLIDKAVPPGGSLLIAGSADAGLLAFSLGVLEGRAGRIVVADRCETPLAVCRRYADARHVAVETVGMDLTAEVPTGPFHAVVAHLFLRFLPPDRRSTFLRLSAAQLKPTGVIIVADMTNSSNGVGSFRSGMRERILTTLPQRGLIIRNEPVLMAALERETRPRRRATSSADIADQAHEAGLRILSRNVSNRPSVDGRSVRQCEYVVLERV